MERTEGEPGVGFSSFRAGYSVAFSRELLLYVLRKWRSREALGHHLENSLSESWR